MQANGTAREAMRSIGRFLIAAAITATSLGAESAPGRVDLIVRGGTVYTGSDAPFRGDVAITGDRIVAVGSHLNLKAARTIDARGKIVAPGFIDPHTHMGKNLASEDPQERLVPAFLMQGVTTAFIGNDGDGEPEIAAALGRAATHPVGINYATYVGFGAVRERVIGEAARAPTAAELARMKKLVADAMCQGAIGLSTGLFYAPQSFSKTDEVIALAREAGLRGGSYDSHIRDESNYTVGLAAAIDEAIRIGRDGQVPVHISHIKALGVDVQGLAPTIVAKIEAARAAGLKVTANQYPWTASGTNLVASLVPPWAQDGGRAAMVARFGDPATLARMLPDMAENLRRRGGADKLLLPDRGKTLAQIAAGGDPVQAAIAIIRAGKNDAISFNQSEADIAAFMTQPWVMTGSDASTGHPRAYGSFARKYAVYVRQNRLLTVRQFIERSSALTADTFALTGRGHLRAGAFADVVVFDPKRYAARATYEKPEVLAAGVRTVVVNGVVAVDRGKLTGAATGRALAHMPTPGTCPVSPPVLP